jgi:HNH endonuclease/AP2 domain
MVSAERVREALHYDPETGVFTWRINKGKMRAGAVAGGLGAKGYWQIGVDNVRYYGHHLAWLYMKDELPHSLIDHKDANRTNNQWRNLRVATIAQNAQNGVIRPSNKSGRKGVSWHRGCGKWQTHIRINGKSVYLGLFDDLELAHQAYASAACAHFGKFARMS